MAKPNIGSPVYTSNAPDGVVTGVIGRFMMVSLASDEYSVQWSAIDDITSWPTPATDAARAVQSGKETLSSEFGKITGITGNDFFGYVFQQKAVTKFTYVGGDIVFQIQPFEFVRGCVDYNRFFKVEGTVFYESEFGYHALRGDQITDIGFGRVDDAYRPSTSISDGQKSVVGNPGANTIFFESRDLAYNYKTDQWTLVSDLNGQGYYPIDSNDGVIGQIVYSGTDVDLQTSDGGVASTAVVTTGEVDLNQGGRSVINGIRPLASGGTQTLRVGMKDTLGGAISWSASTTPNTRTNMANVRQEGRYARVEITVSGGFTAIMGADIDYTPQGRV
jgi:hypothetical protein